MTSAESTLLGIGVGAALAWLAGWIQSHIQWQREEHRRRADLLAKLYEDMLAEQNRLHTAHIQQAIMDERPTVSAEEEDRLARYRARLQLFGSPNVRKLWDEWHTAWQERWTLLMGPDPMPPGNRVKKANEDLVRQMRKELESPDRARIRLRRNS